MASLLKHNPLLYKSGGGFDYPIFYDFYERAVGQVWRHQEVAMESDLRDWQQATDLEREIISGILKGFVTSELGIGCYWGEEVCDLFPKPEIRAMARAFSFYEQIHAAAYSYLNDLLGLDEYEAFVSDPIAMKKVETFFQKLDPKVSLAIFSAGGEGISLFASFAALLAFNLSGRFKGLAQIISWSAKDENLHSDAGCLLFKELVKEVGITREEEQQIYDGVGVVLDNELAFIDSIFAGRSIPKLDPEDLKAFIKTRYNIKMIELGLRPKYMPSETVARAQTVSSWFYPMVEGASSNDFFAQSKDGNNYAAKISQNFLSVDFSKLDLTLPPSLELTPA